MRRDDVTLLDIVLYVGVGLTLLGLVGVIACIVRAKELKSEPDEEKARLVYQGLVAINIGSVGIAFLGLGLIIVALIL